MGEEELIGQENVSTLATASENDGKITLTFLNDDYEVRGDFYPPMSGGDPISVDYIRSLLQKFNITHGINKEEIRNAYRECIEDQRVVRDVLIAQGDLPVTEILEYMQLNPILDTNIAQENEAVDHRIRSPFVIVKKDQALAKQKSRKPGKDGINIHGEVKEHESVRPEGVSGGEHTRMDGRFLLSNINGQMIVEKKVINVKESLVTKGSVGYGTGNIVFPGNVVIEGPVSDGFKIYSGGSVTIKQTFDVTDVNEPLLRKLLGDIISIKLL